MMIIKKRWPIPDDDHTKLWLFCELLYKWIPDSKYRVGLRKHNLAIGPIIEDTNAPVFDSQYGGRLPYIKGFKVNGGGKHLILDEYQEPRFQKVSNTGKIKNTMIGESDIFVLLARNTSSLDDSNDNFTWEANENEIIQLDQYKNLLDQKEISISDLTDKVNEYRMLATSLQTQAETFSREAKTLQDKVNLLQQENFDLQEQTAELYRQNKILTTNKIIDEAKIETQQMNAEEIGEIQGMDTIQVVEKSMDKIRNVLAKADSLNSGDHTQEEYKNTIGELRGQFLSLKESVEKILKNNEKKENEEKKK